MALLMVAQGRLRRPILSVLGIVLVHLEALYRDGFLAQIRRLLPIVGILKILHGIRVNLAEDHSLRLMMMSCRGEAGFTNDSGAAAAIAATILLGAAGLDIFVVVNPKSVLLLLLIVHFGFFVFQAGEALIGFLFGAFLLLVGFKLQVVCVSDKCAFLGGSAAGMPEEKGAWRQRFNGQF